MLRKMTKLSRQISFRAAVNDPLFVLWPFTPWLREHCLLLISEIEIEEEKKARIAAAVITPAAAVVTYSSLMRAPKNIF